MSSARRVSTRSVMSAVMFLLCCCPPAFTQKAPTKTSTPLKYDFQTESKARGVVDEVKVLDFGTRKDFIELILKDESQTMVVYVCPKPFEEEMGITFAKGEQISFTGSKVKGEESEVILAREIVKGTDTWTFRDAKGSPVWDPRTGK
jgi:hypothetical protein